MIECGNLKLILNIVLGLILKIRENGHSRTEHERIMSTDVNERMKQKQS